MKNRLEIGRNDEKLLTLPSQVGMTLIIDMEGVGMEWLWPPGIGLNMISYIMYFICMNKNLPLKYQSHTSSPNRIMIISFNFNHSA